MYGVRRYHHLTSQVHAVVHPAWILLQNAVRERVSIMRKRPYSLFVLGFLGVRRFGGFLQYLYFPVR